MKQTAVEQLEEYLTISLGKDRMRMLLNEFEKAKAIEKQEKIEFACQVAEASAEKYIQGKTTWQIAEELLTFKSE